MATSRPRTVLLATIAAKVLAGSLSGVRREIDEVSGKDARPHHVDLEHVDVRRTRRQQLLKQGQTLARRVGHRHQPDFVAGPARPGSARPPGTARARAPPRCRRATTVTAWAGAAAAQASASSPQANRRCQGIALGCGYRSPRRRGNACGKAFRAKYTRPGAAEHGCRAVPACCSKPASLASRRPLTRMYGSDGRALSSWELGLRGS